ncbi:tetratricopeptide repeat protein [Salinimicrobium sp. GXAS 041]|uniref:tetratricopeptide repeat protein n=1 Tax=Salinimicrobium sp. GXAS 041 TaxID=3400806 RepID=UPI003C773179
MKYIFLGLALIFCGGAVNGQSIKNHSLQDTVQSGEITGSNEKDEAQIILHYNNGRRFDQAEKYKDAIAEYSKSIDHDTLFVQGYFARGTAKINDSQYGSAIQDFDKVLELKPKYGKAYVYRSFARMKKYRNSKSPSNTTAVTFKTELYRTPPIASYHGRKLTKAEKKKVCKDYEKGLLLSKEKSSLEEILQALCLEE